MYDIFYLEFLEFWGFLVRVYSVIWHTVNIIYQIQI